MWPVIPPCSTAISQARRAFVISTMAMVRWCLHIGVLAICATLFCVEVTVTISGQASLLFIKHFLWLGYDQDSGHYLRYMGEIHFGGKHVFNLYTHFRCRWRRAKPLNWLSTRYLHWTHCKRVHLDFTHTSCRGSLNYKVRGLKKGKNRTVFIIVNLMSINFYLIPLYSSFNYVELKTWQK